MAQHEGAAPESQLKVVTDRRPAAGSVKFYRIRDFERLQHYRDRALVWVKLYVEQLDDYEFLQLPDAMKYHVHALMLLAARSGNKIPNDPLWVSARIGASDPVDLHALAAHGFLEPWKPKEAEEYEGGEQLPLPTEADEAAPPGGHSAVTSSPPVSSAAASKLLAETENPASNLLAQNRTEQNRSHTDTERASARQCDCCGASVCSEFSYQQAFGLVMRWKTTGRHVGGKPIENPGGLARTLHREGTADEEIREMLRAPPRELGPACRNCARCRGTGMSDPDGRGMRPCRCRARLSGRLTDEARALWLDGARRWERSAAEFFSERQLGESDREELTPLVGAGSVGE